MNLRNYIYNIPDFPKRGITFKDITPLAGDGPALEYTIDQFAKFAKKLRADVIVSPESRGFIFGAPVAYELGLGFVPAREAANLPREVYKLPDGMAIHKDAIKKGMKVVIIDDLIASGKTMLDCAKLVEALGGEVVGIACVAEISGLGGLELLKKYKIFKLFED